MSPLSRESLADGSLRQRLARPGLQALTDAQVAQSLASLLAQRPPGPAWVFGYGSLIWNPLLAHDAECNAMLHGWQRSFCLRSISGRGTPEQPGRMLSLAPGGSTQGLALRLPADRVQHELGLLWQREMLMGSYLPAWLPVRLADGRVVQAITFVANPRHPQHCADACVQTVAATVARARGVFGPNIDYVLSLHRALAARGLADAHVDAIVAALAAAGPLPPPAG
jgi:cation transport protein ChaC